MHRNVSTHLDASYKEFKNIATECDVCELRARYAGGVRYIRRRRLRDVARLGRDGVERARVLAASTSAPTVRLTTQLRWIGRFADALGAPAVRAI
jgi:hypothetical protein